MSAPGPFHAIAQPLQLRGQPIALVALDFDSAILHRSTCAAAIFEQCGKLAKPRVVQRNIGEDGHALAAPAFRFASDTHHGDVLCHARLLALRPRVRNRILSYRLPIDMHARAADRTLALTTWP